MPLRYAGRQKHSFYIFFHCTPPIYFPVTEILLCLSVKNLHDRWARDCATHRELYNKKRGLEPTQKISWGPLLDEKQVSSSFGLTCSS